MLKLLSFFVALPMLTGCKTSKLSEDDLKWNPYKGNEVLIFENNNGDMDTIFILKVHKEKVSDDPLATMPKYHETLSIGVRHSDPTPPDGGHRYLEGTFFRLTSTENKNTHISFDLAAKKAWFYSGNYYKEELKKLPAIELSTKNFKYNDIIKLEPKSVEYADRNEFITAVYWSKSNGYIRFDLKNGVYWELIKKYSSP